MPYQEGERQERTPYLENYIRARACKEVVFRNVPVQTEFRDGKWKVQGLGLRASGSRGQGFKVLRMSKV